MNVLTQRNSVDRRGVNDQETILNPRNVNLNTFGKLGGYPIDGDVYAQPLYVSRVKISDTDVRDLLIVATMKNSVFAFDANANDPAHAQIWMTNLGSAVFAPQFVGGEYRDIADPLDPNEPFEKHTSTIGVLGTPVIEATIDPTGLLPTTGIIYVVTFTVDQTAFNQTKSSSEFKHFLHALNLRDGKPVRAAKQIEGTVSGAGYTKSGDAGDRNDVQVNAGTSSKTVNVGGIHVRVVDCENLNTPNAVVRFNSMMQLQRPGLLLHQGKIISGCCCRGDENPYQGWGFAYDSRTFELSGLLCTTPNGAQGGIWQAGQGLLVDSKGNIYAGSGNGDSEETVSGTGLQGRNLAESFIQLRLDTTGLRVNGWFNAFDDFRQAPGPETPAADQRDDDLGASAPALLPDDRIVGGGKDGWFYLIDPDRLDKTGRPKAVPQTFKASFNFNRGSRNTVGNDGVDRRTHHIHGTPVVWDSVSNATFVYVCAANDVVRAYQYAPEVNHDPSSGRFIDQPQNFVVGQVPPQGVDLARGNIYASNEEVDRKGMPGGMLSLSVDGSNPSSAILWASFPPFHNGNRIAVEGSLIAYDASGFDTNVGFKRLKMLWNSRQNPGDDLGLLAKFCCPTIANGRVFQATASKQVAVYGITPADGGYNLGFGGTMGLTLNGSAVVTKDGTIVLTEHAHHQSPNRYADGTPTLNAGSFFTNEPVDITRFMPSFTFQLSEAAADGFTLTIQAEGPHAIGSGGSGLGYMVDMFDSTQQQFQSTVTHSFALKFVLGDPDNTQTSQMGLLLNGMQFPGFIDVNLRQGPDLNLRTGKPITARVRYDGNNLFVQLHDPTRNVTTGDFALIAGNIALEIHSITGKAFVGFTGGTGMRSARQEILKWDFQPGTFA